jgi:hypothetical protein
MSPSQVSVSTVANVSLALHFDGAQLGANATSTIAGLRAALADLALGYRPSLIEVAPQNPGPSGGDSSSVGDGSSGGDSKGTRKGKEARKDKEEGRADGGRRLLWGSDAGERLEEGLAASLEFSAGWKARARAWRAAVARLLAQAGAGDPHDGGWDEDAYAAYTQVGLGRRLRGAPAWHRVRHVSLGSLCAEQAPPPHRPTALCPQSRHARLVDSTFPLATAPL